MWFVCMVCEVGIGDVEFVFIGGECQFVGVFQIVVDEVDVIVVVIDVIDIVCIDFVFGLIVFVIVVDVVIWIGELD